MYVHIYIYICMYIDIYIYMCIYICIYVSHLLSGVKQQVDTDLHVWPVDSTRDMDHPRYAGSSGYGEPDGQHQVSRWNYVEISQCQAGIITSTKTDRSRSHRSFFFKTPRFVHDPFLLTSENPLDSPRFTLSDHLGVPYWGIGIYH